MFLITTIVGVFTGLITGVFAILSWIFSFIIYVLQAFGLYRMAK